MFFKRSGNDNWEYKKDGGVGVFPTETGTNFDYALYHDDLFYLVDGTRTTLKTFTSCDYNSVYNTLDTSRNSYDEERILANRNCTQCPDDRPFSYGF